MPESSPDGWLLSDGALNKTIKGVRRILGQPVNPRPNGGQHNGFSPHNIQSVTNNTGETLVPRSVVQIDTPSLAVVSGSDLVQIVPKAVKPSTSYAKLYGISVGTASTNGDGSQVSLTGGLVTYTGTAPVEGQSVGPVPASFAVSTTAPPYFTVVGISTAETLCEVVPFHYPTISPVTLSAPLSAGGTVSVSLSDGRVVSATNKAGQILQAGSAMCLGDQYDGSYYLTGSAQPSTSGSTEISDGIRWFRGTLTTGLLSTDASIVIDGVEALDGGAVPTTPRAANSFKDYGAENAFALFAESPGLAGLGVNYLLARVQRNPQREYKGTLSAALASTDATASISGVTALDGLAPPSTATISASNLTRWSGQTGWNCLFTDDWSSSTQAYILRAVQFVDTQVQTDTTFNSTELKANYLTIPLPLGSGSTTVTVFATTEASAVVSVATTGVNLVQNQRPYRVFAVGATSQATVTALPEEWVTQIYMTGNELLYDTNLNVGTTVFGFTTKTIVEASSFTSPTFTNSKFTAGVYNPSASTAVTVFTGSTCT